MSYLSSEIYLKLKTFDKLIHKLREELRVQGKEDLHGGLLVESPVRSYRQGMLTFDLGLFNPADCSQVRQFAGGHGVG